MAFVPNPSCVGLANKQVYPPIFHHIGSGCCLVWWQRPLLFFLLVLWQAMRDRGTEPPEELSFPPDDVMQKEHTRSIDYHLKWGHGPWLGRASLLG